MKSIDWRSQEGFDNRTVMSDLNKLIDKHTHPESDEEGILHGIQKEVDLVILTDYGQYTIFKDQIGYVWFKLPDGECRVLYASVTQFISEVMVVDRKLRDLNVVDTASIEDDHDYYEVD